MKKVEVKIDQETFEQIKTLIVNHSELGYETVREFVIVACFLLLEELHKRSAVSELHL